MNNTPGLQPGLIVNVTESDGNYVGHVVKDNSGDRCSYPVGKLIWTIHGSAPNYTGTHVDIDDNDGDLNFTRDQGCTDLPMAATFKLKKYSNSDERYLDMCVPTDHRCTIFHRTATDTTPPKVTLKVPPGIIGIGEKFTVRWSVTDDSKKAKTTLTLYSGGDVVATETSRRLVKATGQVREGTADPGSRYPGPFYICLSAVDGAGNTSAATPGPKCKWLSIQVPVSRVSNGCGGAQWGPGAEAVQNWLLDTQEYGGVTVNFRAACNQHDAGYAGATVADPFLKKVVDFRTWSRAKIDEKFAEDLQTLCHKYLDDQNVTYKQMWDCLHGLSLADWQLIAGAGALTYYEGVRQHAQAAFDTNVVVAGTQTDNMPSTWPQGGGRDNT